MNLDEAVALCRQVNGKLPPHLAAWLVARELEERVDQPQLGQALYDLIGGSGPAGLAEIITRMVHPDAERRWPVDGRTLREALAAFITATGRPASQHLVDSFLGSLANVPKPRDSGEWLTDRPQLDASGRVHGQREAATPAPTAAAFRPPVMPDAQLELARPAKRPENEWSEPAPYRDDVLKQRKSPLVPLVIGLVVLGLAAVGAFIVFPTLQRKLPLPLPGSHSLLITSEPDGAAIFIDGQNVGSTPLAGDNRWRGKPKLELKLEGYETFRDSFEGGKDAHIAATLRKKR